MARVGRVGTAGRDAGCTPLVSEDVGGVDQPRLDVDVVGHITGDRAANNDTVTTDHVLHVDISRVRLVHH